MISDELHRLVAVYVEGIATKDEVRQLDAMLARSPDARRWFIELCDLDCAIQVEAARWMLEQEESVGQRTARPWPLVGWFRPYEAAVLAFVCTGLLIPLGLALFHTPHRPVATIVKVIGDGQFRSGSTLGTRSHELTAGAIELVTARGVGLVIEAPASFRFDSADLLRLERGRIAADVPAAGKGFTVLTPSGKAVDLGTRFGIDVELGGSSEVHVFEGEVIAESARGGRVSVRDGEAVSLGDDNEGREMRSGAFIRDGEIPSLYAAVEAGQVARSQAMVRKIRSDTSLIALFDFEGDDRPAGQYRLVQGRWPGSIAPDFSKPDDHMLVDFGGDRAWPQVTFAAWVRLDRVVNRFQSLYHTDGWNLEKPGQVHWLVAEAGALRFSPNMARLAADMSDQNYYPTSRSVLDEKGRWSHVATVYDSDTKTTRFFLDGLLNRETRLAVAPPAMLGPARIGNWNWDDRKLSGRVDEFVVWGRCLTAEEIGDIHVAGSPYR